MIVILAKKYFTKENIYWKMSFIKFHLVILFYVVSKNIGSHGTSFDEVNGIHFKFKHCIQS